MKALRRGLLRGARRATRKQAAPRALLGAVRLGCVGGVGGPVAAGFGGPADRGARGDPERVGEDRGGDLGGELHERGGALGAAVDGERLEPSA